MTAFSDYSSLKSINSQSTGNNLHVTQGKEIVLAFLTLEPLRSEPVTTPTWGGENNFLLNRFLYKAATSWLSLAPQPGCCQHIPAQGGGEKAQACRKESLFSSKFNQAVSFYFCCLYFGEKDLTLE